MPLRMPEPLTSERPTTYADRIGEWYTSVTPAEYRKQQGQYFTPIAVADFMAGFCSITNETVRVLDPGAGAGILTCAVCEFLARSQTKPKQIIVEAYETDPELFIALQKVLQYLEEYLKPQGVSLILKVSTEDFILKYAPALDRPGIESCFDLVISNPPYFKIPKPDPRAQAAALVVHGQPNMYALFMAVAAAVLVGGGEFISITPRSFTSGLYFRRFREYFFSKVHLEAIHVFESRRDTFKRDDVLQESIILKARRSTSPNPDPVIRVSSSLGINDVTSTTARQVPLDTVLSSSHRNLIVRLPHSEEAERLIQAIQLWPGSLHDYGFEISTGPVVPFRAVPLLSDHGNTLYTHAPLLWMQNVQVMKIQWPIRLRKKPQYIQISDDARALLLPDKNYVLVRRVSAKEDRRRITAAPYMAGGLGSDWLGLENHLNYIYKPESTLSEDEAWGLAVLLNSSFLDAYFRTFNGNTQVSATELRSMPLPHLETITQIGYQAKQSDLSRLEEWASLSVPGRP